MDDRTTLAEDGRVVEVSGQGLAEPWWPGPLSNHLELTGPDGLLTGLTKRVLVAALASPR